MNKSSTGKPIPQATETQNNIADFFAELSNILQAADASFWNSYMEITMEACSTSDGRLVAATIDEVMIEKIPNENLPMWSITSAVHNMVVYVLRSATGEYMQALEPTTIEGFCQPECDCAWCEELARQLAEVKEEVRV